MGDEKHSITHAQGQQLLMYSSLRLPEKLGDESFSTEVRSNADDQLASLRGALRAVSPMLNESRRVCFGQREAWERKENEQGEFYQLSEPTRPIDVLFSEDALNGAYWAILLMLHPSSPRPAPIGEVEEHIYPLVDKLGWRGEINRAIKLDRKKAKTLVRDQRAETK